MSVMSKAGILDFCGICSARLPLRVPLPDEGGVDWQCVGCGTLYFAILRDNAPAEQLRNVVQVGAARGPEAPTHESLVQHGVARQALPAVAGVRSHFETDFSRRLDLDIDNGAALKLPTQMDPFIDDITRPGADLYSKDLFARHYKEYRANATRVDGLYGALKEGRKAKLKDVQSLSVDLLDQLKEDLDLQMRLSLHAIEGAYPSNQGLRSAMLAASIAASMGYDEQTLQHLIMGCVLHDAGMQSLGAVGVDSNRVFTMRDYSIIAAHPVHTFELLGRDLDNVPPETQMVAYQMHERCDGQGYPRGRAANQIHTLAKIASVADAFVALVSPRPHRDGLMPYFAIEQIINDTRAGLYDSNVTRGLLRTVSLFPVGSTISIGDDMVGCVVRTNPEQYDRPLVEIRLRSRPKADPVVVDLNNYASLPIRPISADAALAT